MSEKLIVEIALDLNTAAVRIAKLRRQVDPGHIPMIRYLRRLETRIDRMKKEFRWRCDREW